MTATHAVGSPVLATQKAEHLRIDGGHREQRRRRGIKIVIPEPADQAGHRKRKGPRVGRPIGYDVLAYRHHNVVEPCFNILRNWRGIATRYDKKVLVSRGGVVLAGTLMWLS
jgi:transposase